MQEKLENLKLTTLSEVEKVLADKIVVIKANDYDASLDSSIKNPDLIEEYDAARTAFKTAIKALYKTSKPTINQIIDYGKRFINNSGNPFNKCKTLNQLSKEEKIKIYFDLIQEPYNITLDVDAKKFVQKLVLNYDITKEESKNIIKNGYVKTYDGYDEKKLITIYDETFHENETGIHAHEWKFTNTVGMVKDRYGFLTEEYVTKGNVDDPRIIAFAEYVKDNYEGIEQDVTEIIGESTHRKLQRALMFLALDTTKKNEYVNITNKIMDQINDEYETKNPSIEQLLDYSKKVALGKLNPYEGSTTFRDMSMREKVQAIFELVQKPLNKFFEVDSDMIMKELVYGYKQDDQYREIKDAKYRRYLPLDYKEEINKPVDDDYTKNDHYESRLWEEEYEESNLIRNDEDGNPEIVNTLYMNDKLVQNCMNNKVITDSNELNKVKEKFEKYRDDLYAFAASMRNEVKLDEDGKIILRSFFQFCVRAFDKNNAPFNNLVKKGYFDKTKLSEIDGEKFFRSCANEVFHVNLLDAKEKTIKENIGLQDKESYFQLYFSNFMSDINNNSSIGENASNRPIGTRISDIDYYKNIDMEIDFQSGERIGVEQGPNEFDNLYNSFDERKEVEVSLTINPKLTKKYNVKKSNEFSTYVDGKFVINPIVFDKKYQFFGYLTTEEYNAIVNDEKLRKANQELLQKYNENKELWEFINKDIKETIKTGPSIIDGDSFMKFMKDALRGTDGKYVNLLNDKIKKSFPDLLIDAVQRNTGFSIREGIRALTTLCQESLDYEFNNPPKKDLETSELIYEDPKGNKITFNIQNVGPLFKDGVLDVTHPALSIANSNYIFRIGAGDNYDKLKDLVSKMSKYQLGSQNFRTKVNDCISWYDNKKDKTIPFMADLAQNLGKEKFDPSKIKSYITSIKGNKNHPLFGIKPDASDEAIVKIVTEGIECLYGIKLEFDKVEFYKMMFEQPALQYKARGKLSETENINLTFEESKITSFQGVKEFVINPSVDNKYGYLTEEEVDAIGKSDLRKKDKILEKYKKNENAFDYVRSQIKKIKKDNAIINSDDYLEFMKKALSGLDLNYHMNLRFINPLTKYEFANFLNYAVEKETGCKVLNSVQELVDKCEASIDNNLFKIDKPEVNATEFTTELDGEVLNFNIIKDEEPVQNKIVDINNEIFDNKQMYYKCGMSKAAFSGVYDYNLQLTLQKLGLKNKCLDKMNGLSGKASPMAPFVSVVKVEAYGASNTNFDPKKLNIFINKIKRGEVKSFNNLKNDGIINVKSDKDIANYVIGAMNAISGCKFNVDMDKFVEVMFKPVKIEQPKQEVNQSQNQNNIVIEENVNNNVNINNANNIEVNQEEIVNNANNNVNNETEVNEEEIVNNANNNVNNESEVNEEEIVNNANNNVNNETEVNEEEIAPIQLNGQVEDNEIVINNENQNINLEQPIVQLIDEPIELSQQDKKRIKDSIMADIVKISKNKFDLGEEIPENEIRTTKTFAKGVKLALSKVQNFEQFPKEFKTDIANSIKNTLDSCIDGVKEAELAKNTFDNKASYFMLGNDPSGRKARFVKNEGLYMDALSSYLRLNEIHEKRGIFFWLFHPWQNSAEKTKLAYMKEQLVSRIGLSEEQISAFINGENGNRSSTLSRMGDDLIEAIVEKCSIKTHNFIKLQVENNKNRLQQLASIEIGDEQQENIEIRNRVGLNPNNLYPELLGNANGKKANNERAMVNEHNFKNKK